jgi:hypothetical protein
MTRWLLPLALLLALVGYFAPWVNHSVSGLVITGLDLGEYVKFLPAVRIGEINIWRAGLYAPLVTVSATATLVSYRRHHFSIGLRFLLLALAVVAALNLVPPAWTPARLLEAEFRVQTLSLVILMLGVAFAPFLALIPPRVVAAIVVVLTLAALVFPLHAFIRVLPAISALYNQPLIPGWGMWLMVASLIGVAALVVRLSLSRPSETDLL